MFASKWRFAVILAATIGVFSLGAIRRNLAFQAAPAPAPAANKVPKEMLEKRRDAARQVWDIKIRLAMRAFRAKGEFNPKISDVFGWSERVLDAELPLCEKKADRIAAFEAHVDRTRQIEERAKALEKFVANTPADTKTATYERINAEIRYFEETGKNPPQPKVEKTDESLPNPTTKK